MKSPDAIIFKVSTGSNKERFDIILLQSPKSPKIQINGNEIDRKLLEGILEDYKIKISLVRENISTR